MSKNECNIVFIGPSGVGKTTILASLYDNFTKKRAKFSPLKLSTPDDTFTDLYKAWNGILKEFEKEDILWVADQPKLDGTAKIIKYEFDFSLDKDQLQFNFIDIRGGALDESNTAEVAPHMKDAVTVICVVDAVKLMEYEGEDARRKCACAAIDQILTEGINNKQQKLNCLFAITKCETYIYERKEELKNKFQDVFKSILDIENLTSYYLPIETLGCLKLNHITNDGQVNFTITKSYDGKGLIGDNELMNIYQPICFVMFELFQLLQSNIPIWKKVLFWAKIDRFVKILQNKYPEALEKLNDIAKDAKELCIYDHTKEKLIDTTGFSLK